MARNRLGMLESTNESEETSRRTLRLAEPTGRRYIVIYKQYFHCKQTLQRIDAPGGVPDYPVFRVASGVGWRMICGGRGRMSDVWKFSAH